MKLRRGPARSLHAVPHMKSTVATVVSFVGLALAAGGCVAKTDATADEGNAREMAPEQVDWIGAWSLGPGGDLGIGPYGLGYPIGFGYLGLGTTGYPAVLGTGGFGASNSPVYDGGRR